MKARIGWLLIATVWGLMIFMALTPRTSEATPTAGLFAEQKTEVTGVVLTRVVDTKNGNVCYVATRADSTGTAAVSCVTGKP